MNSFFTRLLLASSPGALLCIAQGWWGWLAWLAPVPLLVGLRRGATGREALWMGIVCGLIEAMILLGLVKAGAAVFATLACAYALGRALFTMGVWWLGTRDIVGLGCASLWILLEAGHAALPMSLPNLLGDTQHEGVIVLLARLGGTWLVGWVMVWSASLIADAIGRPLVAWSYLLAPAAVVALLLGVATQQSPTEKPSLRVGLVQGGIPSWLYQRSHAEKAWRAVPAEIYQRLTQTLGPTDLVVWPEAPLPYRWGQNDEFEAVLEGLDGMYRPILTGAYRADVSSIVYNAALLLDSDGGQQWVEKRRLALQAELWLTPGSRLDSLSLPNGTQVGVVFCLESVLPSYAQTLVASAGAEVLVVLADGSRFGSTPVGKLHGQRSALRAVETGRAVVHAGQHGYTAVYLPDGGSSKPWPLFEARAGIFTVPVFGGLTPFSRWPRGSLYIMGGLLAVAVVRRLLASAKSAP
ncbi:MAG: nitrilase-related carbon-nitrogen hydrolase [Myxococcota bacterium]|nr:nitrilase-related carbon-nitrogen hydrolase [Myxococcota bacterium]